MFQSLYRILIELTNGQYSSGLLKHFSQSRWSRPLILLYVKTFNLNQQEFGKELKAYTNLHELFTRQLKADARPITAVPSAVACPVDGVLEDSGEIRADKKIVVKGKIYSMEEMLGDELFLEKYLGGKYLVLYLSPSHYHRIHAPIKGSVIKRWTLGRKSYPVNKWGMKYGKEPLSKNYRTITELQNEAGNLAMVKVGAMFINSIVITDESDELEKGQEFSYFSFGSTVVLLFEKGSFELEGNISIPADVRVGETIGFMRAV
ncbi:phosphatidylserine decarboxylase [Peribacillus simplex]|uniref:Phosphatidylserine decarboxylase proenzyme n=2 Tax=Peribacillus TaxID=2675229 RepID=A0AA90P7B6_9BACI|nr:MULTISPECIES: phosphatidylserine decarboxylase [Peribacillus]MDP1420764.1 phosphatidylserine decarboxylase [Peribacillus simplex]MDP1453541.1 phosphatidylserine decarboxylase [Peribacillus frigoritolerans]